MSNSITGTSTGATFQGVFNQVYATTYMPDWAEYNGFTGYCYTEKKKSLLLWYFQTNLEFRAKVIFGI
jgi:hypothetical protein